MMRRSGFTRKAPEMRASSSSTTAKAKDYACAWCGGPFLKLLPLQAVCGPLCAGRKAKADRVAKVKQERESFKARKAAAKTPKELKPIAQDAFNAWVRARDADLPCVSCGETNPPMTPGGQWDAGHFLGRGAYPELRFNEDNCHKQCKTCNGGGGRFKHKERVVSQKYEEELLRRIGPERLAALKSPHPLPKLKADDYRQIAATYRAKLKELKGRL